MANFYLKLLFITTLGCISNFGYCQSNEIKIKFIGNCELYLTDGKSNIYIDFPYKSGAHNYMEYDKSEIDNVKKENSIFIFTHKHADHYSKSLLKKMEGNKYGPWNIDKIGNIENSIANFSIDAFKTQHKVLEFKKEQVLTLEPMQYTLRYILDDSTQNKHSVTFYPQHRNVNLTCFFFNKSYPLDLRTMKNNDYIELISRYAGNTNMYTMIPIHSLIIVKKRRNYYALYQQAATNEQGRLIGDIPLKQVIGKKIKIDENYMKLTNEQLLTIEEFWNTMHIYWVENESSGNYIPYLTIINDKNGRISFQSKGSISEMLWKKLN